MLPPVTRKVHSPHASFSKASGKARQISRSLAIVGFESSYIRGCAMGMTRLFLMGRDPPGVARGILDAADAIAPGHVGWLSYCLGAKTQRALVGRVRIGNINVDRC